MQTIDDKLKDISECITDNIKPMHEIKNLFHILNFPKASEKFSHYIRDNNIEKTRKNRRLGFPKDVLMSFFQEYLTDNDVEVIRKEEFTQNVIKSIQENKAPEPIYEKNSLPIFEYMMVKSKKVEYWNLSLEKNKIKNIEKKVAEYSQLIPDNYNGTKKKVIRLMDDLEIPYDENMYKESCKHKFGTRRGSAFRFRE
ncbi:hypothetical protein ACFL1H_04775 [Nanoarchaeota archaeon]